MERRLLKAKRSNSYKADQAQEPRQQCAFNKNTHTIIKESSFEMIKPPARNMANQRMKRLRESLAKSIEQNEIISPPAKRFAPQTQSSSLSSTTVSTHTKRPKHLQDLPVMPAQPAATVQQHSAPRTQVSTEYKSNYKSPKKHFVPDINITLPRSKSMNKRLRHPVTSTPNLKKLSKSCGVERTHLNFSQFDGNNQSDHTASTSGIGLLYDDDENITDISAPENSYSTQLDSISNNSSGSLFCNANNSNRDEDFENMDWSPVSEEQLLSNIREARDSYFDNKMPKPMSRNTGGGSTSSLALLNMENVHVIVDTNIFIDKLQTIINIMHLTYTDNSYPVIYVPWMVIQELDYFKDGYSLSEKHPVSKIIQTRCRKAVKFINECLIARKKNFCGQPVQQAADTHFKGQNADDSILACCVQLFAEGFEVILLSSDTNLRNKAMISNINAFSPIDIMKELKKKTLKKINFVDEISKKLALICSFVLHFEIKSHLGERQYEQHMFKNLPWQFRDCVKYLKDYYDDVFRTHLPKQCRKVVDDLHEFLFVNEEIVNEFKYMELCLSLLIYFQTGMSKYEANIQSTIQEIKELEREFFG